MNKIPELFFHISNAARSKYRFEDEFYSLRGNLVIITAASARKLANKINSIRQSEGKTDQFVTAGQVNTLGLLHEIFHYLIRYYEENESPGVFARGINHLKNNLNEEELTSVLSEYITSFPPLDVYKSKVSVNEYLDSTTTGRPNKEIILEEIILLNLENINPATRQLEELYSEKPLTEKTKYLELLSHLEKFFINEKLFGPENLPLIHFLRKPILESPFNLDGQLDYILKNWGIYVYDRFGKRLLTAKDIVFEDSKLFLQFMGGKGTPPVPDYDLAKLKGVNSYYEEYERFTRDIEWMPNVVMIAKNIFVWLDQLSKKYQREIKRLNEIPDEELDRLARWNFNALWLIGIWERSSASRKIKQMMGNPEAASSAYSLFDYVIAYELGGEDAFHNLRDRAWQRGIRLASDMVPNHTGIYSKWVVEKPNYFIQTDYPPFPGYSFTGPNLSDDPRVEVRIEDKYYNRTDAAVAFQRRDSYTGDVKYIYHGNDGTHMPWNDTAQLNLLDPEVRESLYQTIKHVAERTSIIRFDAAMTLTKKHYQRLWFPQPGTGGAIPSRSDFGLTREEFDHAMKNEFWREVVDRINRELPHTLLLAEAFWLMEGYFVRTLGMHRVYNSAFMHMLMKEENEKYRLLIKKTLDFNPEILKRYVNFMSNPDEETAVNQFGKGDKYFGVAVMMATLPGLPMFGHGQVEGFSEKYGMEYKKAYYNEFVDENLVSRHEHEIFPLLRRRYMFSQVERFELYDFIDNFGNTIENVFVYSNGIGNERSLIIYNNSYTECKGTINWSAPKVYSTGGKPENKKLAEALGLKNEDRIYYSYRDYKTKFQFLISSRELHNSGFYIALNGYDYRACLDFNEIYDTDGSWEKLYYHLGGRGVYSLDQEMKELKLNPFHQSIIDFLDPTFVSRIKSEITQPAKDKKKSELTEREIEVRLNNVMAHLNRVQNVLLDSNKITNEVIKDIYSERELIKILRNLRKLHPVIYERINRDFLSISEAAHENNWVIFLSILLFSRILNSNGRSNKLFDELILGKALRLSLEKTSERHEEIGNNILLIKILASDSSADGDIKKLLDNNETRWYIGLNEYEGIKYFNKERFENLFKWIFSLKILKLVNTKSKRRSKPTEGKKPVLGKSETAVKNILKDYKSFEKIRKASDNSGYKFDQFLSSIGKTRVKKKPASKREGTKRTSSKETDKKKKRG